MNIDFDQLIYEGWNFGHLEVEEEFSLRARLRYVRNLPGSYSIVLDEIGTPAFKADEKLGPSSFFAMEGLHPKYGEIYLFANPNGEGFVLSKVAIAELFEERNNG